MRFLPVPLLGLLLAGLVVRQDGEQPLLREPAPAVAFQPAVVPDLEAHACRSCHAEVTAEWASSAHGLAWVDEEYQDTISNRKRPELCHGCHVPEPLFLGPLAGRPGARTTDLVHGIDCVSCHVDADGAQLGPRGQATEAHASKRSEFMSAPGSNELCSACHSTNVGPVLGIAKDFAATGMAQRGLSCVGCHMAPVTRAWASDAQPHEGRSHALQTPRDPAFLRLAFRLALRWERAESGGHAQVLIANQAGHRVPGLVGRRLEWRAELLDASGTVLESVERVLDERAYLPVDGTLEIPFTRSAPPNARIHVTGVHHDPRASSAIPFLDETLADQGG